MYWSISTLAASAMELVEKTMALASILSDDAGMYYK
jgi:hypothetical protein